MELSDIQIDRVNSKSSITQNVDQNNINYNTISQKILHLRSNSLETIWAFDNPTFLPDGLPSSVSGEYGLPPINSADIGEYDPHDFGKQVHATSYWGTVFHVLIVCSGPAVLTIPKNMVNVNYVVGCISTFLIILLYAYNITMFVEAEYELCKKKRTPNLSYSDTVYYSFLTGPIGTRNLAPYCRFLTYIVFVIIWAGGCCFNLVLIGENFQTAYKLIDTNHEIGLRTTMSLVIIPLLLLCWIPNLKFLIPISIIGNCLNIFSLLTVVYYAMKDSDFHPPPTTKNTSFWNLPLLLGTVLFCINGTGIMMPLKNDMKEPKRFGSAFGVVPVSFISIGCMYTIFELICLLKFGVSIKDSVVLNLPQDLLITKIVLLMYALSLCFQFPLLLYVVYDTFWNNILKDKHDKISRKTFWEYFTKTTMVVLIYIVGIAVPHLDVFLSFCGTIGTSVDSMIFPAVVNTFMYLKKSKTSKHFKFALCKNALICAFAIVLIILGIQDCFAHMSDST